MQYIANFLNVHNNNGDKNIVAREEYLERLKKWKDKDLIKVVTGIRRCGNQHYFNYTLIYYIFLYEVQNVEEFQKAIDGLYIINIVYLELIRRVYKVYIWKTDYDGIKKMNVLDWLVGKTN